MRERLGKELLFLDGGMGTFCRSGDCSRESFRRHGISESLGRSQRYTEQYYEAGSDIVLANTFGAMHRNFTMTPGR